MRIDFRLVITSCFNSCPETQASCQHDRTNFYFDHHLQVVWDSLLYFDLLILSTHVLPPPHYQTHVLQPLLLHNDSYNNTRIITTLWGYLIIAKYFTHSAIKYNQGLIYFPFTHKTKKTWLERFHILSPDTSRKWADFITETFLNINACELHGQQSFARKGEAEVN